MTRSIELALVAFAPLFALGCSDETSASENLAAEVGEELVDMVDDARNFIDLDRNELIAALEQRQTEFADLERALSARAESLTADAQQEWSERREEVERLRAELATGILELKTASADEWKDLRERLVGVVTDLRRELASAALPEEG